MSESIQKYLDQIHLTISKSPAPDLVCMNGKQLIKSLKLIGKEYDWVDEREAYMITKDSIRVMTEEDMI